MSAFEGIDPQDLIDFAKSYMDMGHAVADQFDDLMNDEFDDINPNAVDVMRRHMRGYSDEIDEKLVEYDEWLAEQEEADAYEPFIGPIRAELIVPRKVYTFESVYSDKRIELDQSDEIAKHQIGQQVCHHAAAPGIGRTVYLVVQIDEEGVWGVVIEDTMRVLQPCETV